MAAEIADAGNARERGLAQMYDRFDAYAHGNEIIEDDYERDCEWHPKAGHVDKLLTGFSKQVSRSQAPSACWSASPLNRP
jgi:hypothetical protein